VRKDRVQEGGGKAAGKNLLLEKKNKLLQGNFPNQAQGRATEIQLQEKANPTALFNHSSRGACSDLGPARSEATLEERERTETSKKSDVVGSGKPLPNDIYDLAKKGIGLNVHGRRD